MARLIPTPEEKATASYLEWDDASLGRFTKYVALTLEKIKDDAEGLHRVTSASAAMLLIASCVECNAGTLTLNIKDHTHGDVHTGDWKLTLKKMRSPRIAGQREGQT